MNAVPFDTLKLAHDLEAAGLATANALDTKIGSLDAKVSSLAIRFDAKLELLRRDMTIRLGSMMFVAVGVILAAMRLTPHP